MSRSSVDLPEPDGPVITWKPPAGNAADTPQIASIVPRPEPYVRVTASIRIAGSAVTGALGGVGLRDAARSSRSTPGCGIEDRRFPAERVDEPLMGVGRRADTLRHRATVANDDDTIRGALDEVVVGYDEARRSLCADEVPEQLQERSRGCPVELAGWLVGEQQAGPDRESRRDRDALLLAPGELPRDRRATIAQPDLPKQLLHAGTPLGGGHATNRKRQLDQLAHRRVRRQRPSVVLLDDGDGRGAVAPKNRAGCGLERDAEDRERTRGRNRCTGSISWFRVN